MLARGVLWMMMVGVVALSGCGRVSGASATLAVSPARGASSGGSAPVPQDTRREPPAALLSGWGSLRGRVVDAASQRPMPGVTVLVEPLGVKVLTDGGGLFQVAQVPAGNYTFKATATNLKQISTNGVLVEQAQTAEVPDLMMAPGLGESGIRRALYQRRQVFAEGWPGGSGGLVNPRALMVDAERLSVLDANSSALVRTGMVKQYALQNGRYLGKYGDYTKWLGLNQMGDTVRAIVSDVQQRIWVLDGAQKLWRFKTNGTKDRVVDLDIQQASDLTVDTGSGVLYVAHAGGVTRLNIDGEAPQPFGQLSNVRAVAAIKGGGAWVLAEQQLLQLDARGQVIQSLGPSGSEKNERFGDATDVIYDAINQFVIVADAGTKNVYVYDAVGVLIGKVGDGLFQKPVGLASDGLGRIYVLDAAIRAAYQFELIAKQSQ
jgi:hypothetical protein